MSTSAVVPFRPKSITAEEAAFSNLARGRSRRMAFQLGGAQWQVRFVASKLTAAGTSVRLTDGNATAWIRLNDWNTIPQVAELAGGAFDTLPADIQSLVLEAAIAPALDAFGNAVGSTWRIEEISSAPTDVSKTIGFELREHAGGMRRGELAMDAAGAALFSELLQRIPPEPTRSLDEIPLSVKLLLGETKIDREALAGLRAHDVLLIERPFVPGDSGSTAIQALALIGERTAFQASMEKGIATLQSPAAVPPSAERSIVRFEIVGAPTSIGAAKSLKPGATLSLASGGEEIRIISFGKTIATGAIVSCAGALGVRLRKDVYARGLPSDA